MASESGSGPPGHHHPALIQPRTAKVIVADSVPVLLRSPLSSLLILKGPAGPPSVTRRRRFSSGQQHPPRMAQAAIAVPSSVQSLPFVHTQNQRGRHASKHRFFIVELSQALFDFVIQLLPTTEEMAVKEDVRKLLERLIRTIEPGSRLLSFGSTANGFSLRNSGQCHSLRHHQR